MLSESTLRLALVIQGPTLSRGLTPVALAARAAGEPVTREAPMLVDYDIRPRLQQMIDRYGHRFVRIVLATWEDQDTDGLHGLEIVKLTTISAEPDQRQSLKRKLALPVNKHRQFFSSLAGLQALEDGDYVDAVFRLRSDVDLNLDEIADWMNSVFSGNSKVNKVFVPAICLPDYQVTDFFFAGTQTSLKNYFTSLSRSALANEPTSVHTDFLLWPGFSEYSQTGDARENAPFPITTSERILPDATRSLIEYTLRNHLRIMPRRVSANYHWRGYPVDESSIDLLIPGMTFQEDEGRVMDQLISPQKRGPTRFVLNRCFDYGLAARCHGRRDPLASIKTIISRLIVRLARHVGRRPPPADSHRSGGV